MCVGAEHFRNKSRDTNSYTKLFFELFSSVRVPKKKKETSKRAYIYTKRLNDACEYIYQYGVSDNNLFLLPMKMDAGVMVIFVSGHEKWMFRKNTYLLI